MSIQLRKISPNFVVGGVPAKIIGRFDKIVKTRGQIKLDFGINPPHGQQMSVDAEYYWESFRHKREE